MDFWWGAEDCVSVVSRYLQLGWETALWFLRQRHLQDGGPSGQDSERRGCGQRRASGGEDPGSMVGGAQNFRSKYDSTAY